jgi:uncharacterized protein YndB with AHSA1/START domain
MKIDIAAALGAVTREVASRDHEGRPARLVVAARTYDTDIDDLWDALTNAERIPRWFMPVSGDLRLGGRYQLQGNAGGEITTCSPPRHLAVTWEHGGQVSWVTVRLAEEDAGRTRLELEHLAHVDEKFWDQFGPGAVGVGWDLAILGLAQHLETRGAFDPKQAMDWPTSPDGKVFVRGSSEGWGAASMAVGTDPAAANAATGRTTAFYTGESPPATD